jgi:hypothetical protein
MDFARLTGISKGVLMKDVMIGRREYVRRGTYYYLKIFGENKQCGHITEASLRSSTTIPRLNSTP